MAPALQLLTEEEIQAQEEKLGARVVVSLSWKPGQDHLTFLTSSQAKCASSAGERLPCHVEHVLDEVFITSFCSLNANASRHVLESLAKLPIAEVKYQDRRPLSEQLAAGPFASRFDQLCEALASWPNLLSATTNVESVGGVETGKILKAATQLTDWKCTIENFVTRMDVEQMLAGLGRHSSIQKVVLTANARLYPMVLPVLQSLPRLKHVRLVNLHTRIYGIIDSGWGRSKDKEEPPFGYHPRVYNMLVFLGALEDMSGLSDGSRPPPMAPRRVQVDANERFEDAEEDGSSESEIEDSDSESEDSGIDYEEEDDLSADGFEDDGADTVVDGKSRAEGGEV